MTAVWPVSDSADRWEAAIDGIAPLEQLVRRSNLLGADRALANIGGGNTSVKSVEADHAGREQRVLWVKGSGTDLATIDAGGFTGLRQDELEPLLERSAMTDEEMTAYVARCQLAPAMPRGSIETLLHAFVPAPHVDHTHPDAINALAGAADGERLVAECFGDAAAWIPYIRPGFTLAKQVGEAVAAKPDLRAVVLAKHGLVCWGETARECYETTVAVVNEAAAFVRERASARPGPAAPLPDQRADEVLEAILPSLRGAVAEGGHKLLLLDRTEPVLELVGRDDASELTQVGAACPDHLVHTKRRPLWIPFDPDADDVDALAQRIAGVMSDYRQAERAYFDAHATDADLPHDLNPRVVLIQRLGMITTGRTERQAEVARDLYHRAIVVQRSAAAVDAFVSLTDAESFAVEYWPLELYKLAQAPPPRELAGQVALVTGAGGGIGAACARTLRAAGATVVGGDLDAAAVQDADAAVAFDVTDERQVEEAYRTAVLGYGGVDIVVSSAGLASSADVEDTTVDLWERNHSVLVRGYFLVAREAFRLLKRQDSGGAVVFVGSKNALASGKAASAYSSAKAAELHLARCLAEEGGAHGIRVNSVNPDAVLQGSRIWDGSWREERARAYGIEPDELEAFYRGRNTLGVSVLPEDVAAAVLHFASPARSGKTTGNLLNVDGGVAAAYPR